MTPNLFENLVPYIPKEITQFYDKRVEARRARAQAELLGGTEQAVQEFLKEIVNVKIGEPTQRRRETQVSGYLKELLGDSVVIDHDHDPVDGSFNVYMPERGIKIMYEGGLVTHFNSLENDGEIKRTITYPIDNIPTALIVMYEKQSTQKPETFMWTILTPPDVKEASILKRKYVEGKPVSLHPQEDLLPAFQKSNNELTAPFYAEFRTLPVLQ